ncbi:MAG: L-ribulose-5-phosphate 3-epimerase [Treponema sp.]|jgi:predicted hexulose-6-phosphate isomerase|nr:L-ribulose-5-phosphate 3-epimerase [Treponema sp.]
MTEKPGRLYRLGLYEKSMPHTLSVEDKLREAKDSGFDYLELSIDESDEKLTRLEWKREVIDHLNDVMEETGVPVKSICLSAHRRFPLGDPEPEIQEKSLAIMEGALSLAARLGVRIIQIAGYDVYYKGSSEITRDFFARNLEKSLRMAAREGIILAFETMETPFMDTVEKAVFWVNRFASPYLQIYPDTGNITNAALNYRSSVREDLEKGGGHVAALHLKESKPGIYREVPYGQGHVSFAEVVKTAWRLGVRLYVAEFWYSPAGGTERWRAALREANHFLRNFLDRAGA